MNIASTIAVSGMNAATLRLRVSASNVANILSDGPLPDAAKAGAYPAAYNALQVDQTDTVGGGTNATVTTASPGTVPVYGPNSPYADSQGMVASPNVDLGSEIIQQLVASYTFAANAQVVRSDAQMTAALFNITA